MLKAFLVRLRKMTSPAPLTIAETVAALGDRSGYVRQSAVGRAAELADPAPLSMLVERVNDWVPNVRDAARAAILELLPKVPPEAVIGILPAVLALRHKSRWTHDQWLAQFEAAMLRHVAPAMLLEAVKGPDMTARRACFDVLSRHALVEQSRLLDVALSSKVDIALAANAANMIHQLPQSLQQARYGAALQSGFGRLRVLGIQGLLRHPETQGKRELAFAHLLDAQIWVRQTAVTFLTAEQCDIKSYYREQLLDSTLAAPQLCIVLTSLASLRDKADVAAVRRYAQHAMAPVRQAALKAWLTLAEEDKDDIAQVALSDDVASVKRMALTLVRRRGAYIAFDSLQADLLARREWELLLEFARFGQWDLLEAVARIAIAAGPEIDAIGPPLRREMVRWAEFNNFTRPTAAQARLLTSEKTRAIFDALYGTHPSFNSLVEHELALVKK